MNVKDVMLPLVESIHPDDTLRDASEKMTALDLDPLPVTETDRLVGLISHEQIARKASQKGLATGSIAVRDVMSTDVACLNADAELKDAVQHLGAEPDSRHYSRLPVISEDGRLVGVVSVETLRKCMEQEDPNAGVAAVFGVESISSLVDYDTDKVDFMSDESFPASDPLPPPSTLGSEDD